MVAGYLFIAPRLKVLDLKTDFFHMFLGMIGLVVPTIIAQKYMLANTGKQTILSSVEEIVEHDPTRYYTFGAYKVNTGIKHYHVTHKIKGRYGNRFKMYHYTLMPIYSSEADWSDGQPVAWLGSYKRVK